MSAANRPPRLATALLMWLGPSHTAEALTGDLLEQYRAGRSRGWYWRQILLAIIIGSFQDLRGHKATALAAVATGWLFLLAYFALVARPLMAIVGGYAAGVLGFAASGWIVGRVYRRHRTAMVLLYVTSILMISDVPRFLAFAADAVGERDALVGLLKGSAFVFFAMRELPMLVAGLCVTGSSTRNLTSNT